MTIRLGCCPHCHASYPTWKGSHHSQAKARTTVIIDDETGNRLEPWQIRAGMITTSTTYEHHTNTLTVRLRNCGADTRRCSKGHRILLEDMRESGQRILPCGCPHREETDQERLVAIHALLDPPGTSLKGIEELIEELIRGGGSPNDPKKT